MMFILGFLIGGTIGFVIAAIVNISGREDDDAEL